MEINFYLYKMHYIIIFLLYFLISVSTFSQISWDFSEPIDIADNTFGNACAQLFMTSNGDPQIIMGKPNVGLYIVNGQGGVFNDPQIIPVGEDILISNTNGPNISRHEDKIGIVYKDLSADVPSAKFIQSLDGGNSWGESVNIFEDGFEDFSIPISSYDNQGNPFIILKIGEHPEIIEGFIRSSDGGQSFLPFININENLGSGITCECCPSNAVFSNDRYYNIFRRNENNLRDFWLVSSQNGIEWDEQIDIDPSDWMVNGCPSSGSATSVMSDGQMATVFMSGGGGSPKIYLNLFNPLNGNNWTTLLSTNQGTSSNQNYPNISCGPSHTAVVWEEFEDGVNVMLSLAPNDEIPNGIMNISESITENLEGSNRYPDIEVFNDKIHVIWQNINEGTVKYNSGTILSENSLDDLNMPKKIVKVMNLYGHETIPSANQILLYIYDDGSVEKKFKIE